MFGKSKPAAAPSTPDASAALRVLKLFTKQLDSESIRYRVDDDKPVVRITYDGENFKNVTFVFRFDDDGDSYTMHAYSVEQFTKDQLTDAYEFCNAMNNKYRWLKFYVDSDDEFTAAQDGVVDDATVGAECSEILHRAVSILDDVCKMLHE